MAVPPLTGRKLLHEAKLQKLNPTTDGFEEFIRKFIYNYHEFSVGNEEQSLDQEISDFVDNWCSHVASLFRSKKYCHKIDLFLNGNHPSYFDREIRFVRPRPSPQPSGRIFHCIGLF